MDHEKIEQAAETNREPAASQRQVASRRRFLKGTSLALPAVMTLHSVSARAQAMSSSSCGNNFSDTHRVFTPVIPGTDDFFRNEVAVYDTLVKKVEGVNIVYEGDGVIAFFGGQDTDGQPVIRDLLGSIVTNPDALDDTTSVNYPGNPNYPNHIPATQFQTPWEESNGKGYAIVLFESEGGGVAAVGAPTTLPGTMVTSLSGACLHSLWSQA
jgi:hypothetical protein